MPVFVSVSGRIIETIKLTAFDPIRNIAIGADSFRIGRINLKLLFILPPRIKYINIAKIDDKTQAME